MSKLTDAIRAKYPDAYKDVNDDDLEKAVLAKYPQYQQYATPKDKPLESDTGSGFPELDAARQTLSKSDELDRQLYGNLPKPPEPEQPKDFGDYVEEGIGRLTRPFESVRNFNKSLASKITDPNLGLQMNGQGGLHDALAKGIAMSKGFAAGVLGGDESGAGGLIDTLVGSPINAAFTATGAAGKVIPETYAGMRAALPMIEKALSAPLAYEGLNNTLGQDKTMGERGQGLLEMAGAVLPFLHSGEPHVNDGDIFAKPDTPVNSVNPPDSGAPPPTPPVTTEPVTPTIKQPIQLVKPEEIPDIEFIDPTTGEILDENPAPNPSPTQVPKRQGGSKTALENIFKQAKRNGTAKGSFDDWVRDNFSRSNADSFGDSVLDNSGRPIAPLEGNEELPQVGNDPRDSFGNQVLPPTESGDIFENKNVGTGNNFAEQKASLDRFREQKLKDAGIDTSRSNSDPEVLPPSDSDVIDWNNKDARGYVWSETKQQYIHPTTAAMIEDTQRMKDAAYRRSQDPVFQAEQKKMLDDWDRTQKWLTTTDYMEKKYGYKYHEDMTPAMEAEEQAYFNSITKDSNNQHHSPFDKQFKGRNPFDLKDEATNRRRVEKGLPPLEIEESNTLPEPTPPSALDRFAKTKDAAGNVIHFHDTGGRFTPEEFKAIATHPVIQSLGNQISDSIMNLFTKMPTLMRGRGGVGLEKTGIVFDDTLRGIHLRDRATGREAVLINPLQIMKMNNPDGAAAGFVHTLLHEAAHLLVGAHNENFTTTLANVYERYGAEQAIRDQQKFLQTVSDGSGGYTPEVQNLLSKYSEARGRPNTRSDALTGIKSSSKTARTGETEVSRGNSSDATGTSSERKYAIRKENVTPETIRNVKAKGYVFDSVADNGDFLFTKGKPKGNQPVLESDVGIKRATRQQMGPYTDQSQGSKLKDAMNAPRALLASMDMSAPLRQGIGLIHKKAFWTSLPDMVKAFASEDAFNAVQESIAEKPLFKRRVVNGKEIPSFAEDAGLKLTDVHDLSNKEESFISRYTQRVPFVKNSERAYVAFLNKLRADTFESLVKQGKIFGADGQTNVALARGLADFVNTATGRGSLGKLESSATTLGTLFFSPRLMASRLKMMNPAYYVMAEPMVRKEALKSLLATAAAGGSVLQLLHENGAEVSDDPNNSDFGKAKIGNVRVDPWAGYQQYIVLLNRLARDKNTFMDIPQSDSGIPMLDMAKGFLGHGGSQITSSNSGHTYDIDNPKFGRSNKFDVAVRFGRGKLNPLLGFVVSLMAGHREITGQKMNFDMPHDVPSLMNNSIAQRFIPLVYQDLYDVYQQDPNIAKYTLPYSFFGGGVQAYQGQKFQR